MPDNDPSEPRRRFQFSLGSLFLAMLFCSVLSTVAAGLLGLGSTAGLFSSKASYVLLAAATPMAVMIVMSLFQAIVRLINRRR